jgi:hypothetical protein
MLGTAELSKESRLVVAYLRDVSAQSEWEQAELAKDLQSHGLSDRSELLAMLDVATGSQLIAVTTVLARAADRAAMALPNALRRVERAQKIGLGTSDEVIKESQ